MTETIVTDPPDARPEVAPARMSVRDLLAEAVAGMFARPKPFSRISWMPLETR